MSEEACEGICCPICCPDGERKTTTILDYLGLDRRSRESFKSDHTNPGPHLAIGTSHVFVPLQLWLLTTTTATTTKNSLRVRKLRPSAALAVHNYDPTDRH